MRKVPFGFRPYSFDQKLSELKTKAESMQEDAKTMYFETIAALQQKQIEATAALKWFKNETGEAWTDMKARLDEMLTDLQAPFDQANG